MSIATIRAKIQDVADSNKDAIAASVDNGDFAGAKRLISAAQKDLRLLKRDVVDEEREVRQSFQDQKLRVSSEGQVLGMFAGSKARGAMARVRAMEKRSLQKRQNDALRPYADLKADIDRIILNIERVKAGIGS